jgi:hypothetical protein
VIGERAVDGGFLTVEINREYPGSAHPPASIVRRAKSMTVETRSPSPLLASDMPSLREIGIVKKGHFY